MRLLICLLFPVLLTAQSDFIHVDQFGYFPAAAKVAVLSDPQVGYNSTQSFTPPATLELRDAATDAVVFSAAPVAWNNGATHTDSGDRCWWFDFSGVSVPGTYYVSTPGGSERSDEFEIGTNIYGNVLRDAARMFYYNRCNHPKAAPYAESPWIDAQQNFLHPGQDHECRSAYDPNNPATARDLSGGWFDAGDYNKYVTFAEEVIHDLLWTYRENPNVLPDNWNIPESGNGIPDLIDEVKWEMDWLWKMTNADGSVILKMGSLEYDQNAESPPSANTDGRFYTPTCTSASIAAAGMLAHAAKVYQDFPALTGEVANMTARAEACFAYFTNALANNALELNCDDITVKAGDADRDADEQRSMAITAAIHLYELTGKAVYHNYLINNLNDAEAVGTYWWGPYDMAVNTALLHYTTLPNADATTRSTILSRAQNAAANQDFIGWSNNSSPYRSSMPDWAYHWGSNRPKANFGNLNMLFARYNLNNNAADFAQKGLETLHYFHGVNPLDMVMLSNMNQRGAGRSVDEIYHTWFHDGTDYDNALTDPYGPAPGYVTGGPNKNYDYQPMSPPYGQPTMKSYAQFNDVWPERSYEITEPAIYYQSAYIRLLAAQQASVVLPVTYAQPLRARTEADGIRLFWETAQEVNAARFEVERETPTGMWQTLGTVRAHGAGNYQFLDREPLVGIHFYRLKQIDADGSYHYSARVSAEFKQFGPPVSVSPNPVENGLLHLANLPANTELRVHDASGKLLLRRTDLRSELDLPTDDWQPGNYALSLVNRAGAVVWREWIVKL